MSKPQPCLRDMPLHVKENIVQNFNELKRFSIRKVSKEFRRIVDNTPTHFKRIAIQLCTEDNNITLTLKTMRNEIFFFVYYKARKGCKIDIDENFVPGKLHVERAILDLAIILKNPKLTIETFRYALPNPPDVLLKSRNVRERNQLFNFLTRELKKLDHKLHVKTVNQKYDDHPGYLLEILPYLQPGTLRKFDLNMTESALWEKVSQTEQWQMAKELEVPYGYFALQPICCNLSHFEKMYAGYCEMELEGFKDLCEKLLEKKSLYRFTFNRVISTFDGLESYISELPDATPGNSSVKIIKDPNSDYSFLCRLTEGDTYDRIDLYKEGVDVDAIYYFSE